MWLGNEHDHLVIHSPSVFLTFSFLFFFFFSLNTACSSLEFTPVNPRKHLIAHIKNDWDKFCFWELISAFQDIVRHELSVLLHVNQEDFERLKVPNLSVSNEQVKTYTKNTLVQIVAISFATVFFITNGFWKQRIKDHTSIMQTN